MTNHSTSADDETTLDGYRIIKARKPHEDKIIKGVQCGQCGMKFDYNKAYGYHCGQSNCPMRYT